LPEPLSTSSPSDAAAAGTDTLRASGGSCWGSSQFLTTPLRVPDDTSVSTPPRSATPRRICRSSSVQVEIEALGRDVLRGHVQDAVAETWDDALEHEVLADEEQRQQLPTFVDQFGEAC
jgi:hypothetical protein